MAHGDGLERAITAVWWAVATTMFVVMVVLLLILRHVGGASEWQWLAV